MLGERAVGCGAPGGDVGQREEDTAPEGGEERGGE